MWIFTLFQVAANTSAFLSDSSTNASGATTLFWVTYGNWFSTFTGDYQSPPQTRKLPGIDTELGFWSHIQTHRRDTFNPLHCPPSDHPPTQTSPLHTHTHTRTLPPAYGKKTKWPRAKTFYFNNTFISFEHDDAGFQGLLPWKFLLFQKLW